VWEIHHLPARNHRTEVVPAGENHLHNVNKEKDAIKQREDEMNDPGRCIAAETKGEPAKLNGLINGQAGTNGTQPQNYNAGVGDLLRPIEFALGWRGLPDMQVMQKHQPRLFEGMPVWNEMTPLAGEGGVEHIYQPVEKEEPHKDKMKSHAFGQSFGEMERPIKAFREKAVKNIVAHPDLIDIVGPIDQHPAPDHGKEHREVDPVHPADSQGMLWDDFFHVYIYEPNG
jgi:hypothetical protein